MSGQKGYLLSYRNKVKQFYISRHTQQHIVSALIKKAFHLASDVKQLKLKHPRGYHIHLCDLFNFNKNQPYQIIIEQDTSEDKSRSQTYSQKALTKKSGRKYPAQQKQLNDAKFYIDDFQFFMQEISSKKSEFLIGILFFNNKKTARYLSKKILRQLIFQFDQVQFFYGLHPLKRHLNTSILGQTLVFSLFKGKKMIHQREFPQNLSAIEEIAGYLKCLIKNNQIPENSQINQQSQEKRSIQRKNLIKTNQQRSFDAKAENDLRLDEFDHIPKVIQKSKTVDKPTISNFEKAPPVLKFDSPIKSQIGNQINQISFENDFYQPQWFHEGQKLNRMQKSLISALVMTGDHDFSTFCHSLDLKNKEKQTLNIGLIKVYIQNFLKDKFPNLNEEQMTLIQLNMQNRQSIVFSLLLKLSKFGSINDFVDNMNNKIKTLKKNKCSYVQLARQIEKRKNISVIRLKGCGQKDQEDEARSAVKLIGKDNVLQQRNLRIADYFFRTSSLMTVNIKYLNLPGQFDEAQKTLIRQSIIQKDPFLVQNYLPSKWSKKKFTVLNTKAVKKYLKQNEKRYKLFKDFPFEDRLKLKLKKVEHFSNLLYYLYKQRLISLKQKTAFMYLFLWSDLNVLGVYQFYLYDRNLQELVQTLYTIDFTYYLQGRYGIQMSQIQNFSKVLKQQLIILFVVSDLMRDINSKVILEKFIRAGDTKIFEAFQKAKSQDQLLQQITQIAAEQVRKLEEYNDQADHEKQKQIQKKEQMKRFLQQIKPAHFKNFKQQDLVNQCIDLNEPKIHGIFQVFFQTNEVVQWIDSFKMYIQRLQEIHMEVKIKNICQNNQIPYDKVHQCRTDLIKGVYQTYLAFKDEEDAAETLKRIIEKPSSFAVQKNK